MSNSSFHLSQSNVSDLDDIEYTVNPISDINDSTEKHNTHELK